jgi:VIT1/CCC1 family predicted Fe2+/Mn2+ transporter
VIGLNPDELGSPWTAAASSFALFSLGSLAPLAPWFFGADMTIVWIAITLTVIGGALAGGFVAYSSGKSIVFGAVRQVGLILFAAGITYFIGSLFGTLTS